MQDKKVKHLKDNNGSWSYRRRVPLQHQKTLGLKIWNRPCGNVTYQKAVALVTEWAEAHDDLIKRLETDTVLADEFRRSRDEADMWSHADTLVELVHVSQNNPSELGEVQVHSDNPLVSGVDSFDPLKLAKSSIDSIEQNSELDRYDKLIRFKSVLEASFGSHVALPSDLDERDEYDLVKRKLERRIASIAGNPNTISAVAERYYKHNGIKIGVIRKYRGNVRKLTDALGDVPISHVSAADLRRFRDQQAASLQPSALASVFTPIRGLFTYALEEEIIIANPVLSVRLQKDRRSVHEKKWTPFPPKEMLRLLEAMEHFWGHPMRGLSDERRKAIHMVCRVMAHSALRPIEVVRLESMDVSNDWIKVRASKTPSSYRTVPLHPKIEDFPAFVTAGGLQTFRDLKTDQVEPVRYNFRRLTRDLMDPPITDPKKVVYSLRSTFSNAMRRAGAQPDVRRAILGHSEGGHLNHYDDGPEFFIKRKWVDATDPTVVYPDTDDYYGEGLAGD